MEFLRATILGIVQGLAEFLPISSPGHLTLVPALFKWPDPTVIAGIYGMKFEHIPEFHWLLGYPMALGLMAAADAVLYRRFRKSDGSDTEGLTA